MKFLTTTLLTLLSISSSFGRYTNPEVNSSLTGGKNIVDLEMQCKSNIRTYTDVCSLGELSNEYLDGSCNILNNAKCKEFFDTPASAIEGCNQLPKNMIESYDFERDTLKIALNLMCQKKDDGKNCPFAVFFANIFEFNEIEAAEVLRIEKNKMLEETCVSKMCVDNTVALIDVYAKGVRIELKNKNGEGYKEMMDLIEEMESFSDELKNKCVTVNGQPGNGQSNNSQAGNGQSNNGQSNNNKAGNGQSSDVKSSDAKSTTVRLGAIIMGITFGLLYYL
ncbi:hypothetical protein BCR36DRAFT_585592 [Piromyces finnis]|uniref:Secreted protein n=1 Tax=Piromyces finnis TaxID=1754191 RepID=A0A1Y1V256_9FUNG|nr:hypothetical protein BCR36DRAFT_585592 [Piromyces finnis]|eukprot:ORX45566.1 hypothetical protein BCR36DRAFT_585592 [Piromyces finnis]